MKGTSLPKAASATNGISAKSPSTCHQSDSFNEAVNKALSAATLAQSAQSKEDWDLVVLRWIQAVERMQAVPPSDPRRAFAQKKVIEYLDYMNAALVEDATVAHAKLPFSTFNNDFLDEKLRLYLSYVAALGPPDVLIVGSSRALLGIDAKAMQQALASKGNENLKVYNLGVNGATAQVVDLIVRQILTQEQLPRLIVWADGVRAFNSGRVDKTYNQIVASPGYRNLLAGVHPTLPPRKSAAADPCPFVSDPSQDTTWQNSSHYLYAAGQSLQRQLAQPAFATDYLPFLRDWGSCCQPKVSFVLASVSASIFDIDSNGFLPVSIRFNPITYYQKNPHIAGLYDADYQAFNLGGEQASAWNTLIAFAQSHKIRLVFVNLPLTQDFLDSTRRRYEQQFRLAMQQRIGQQEFVFLDLGSQWLNRNENFADPSHLNRFGADVISHQLADELRIPWPRSH
jgi:hypothetical protein